MQKSLTFLVTVLSLLGFVQLVDLVAVWLYAALIGYRDKR